MKEFLHKHLRLFFPQMRLEEQKDEEPRGNEDGIRFQLLTKPGEILSYIQTLFFEERLIEVQIDGGTRLFFASLWDHPPELEEKDVDGERVLLAPEYDEGSYLKAMEHLVLSPLEPVTGNIKVRTSNALILRFYTGTTAVEMGSRFLRAATIHGNQVQIIAFPDVGRVIPNNRPFRAKIPKDYSLLAEVNALGQARPGLSCRIMDLSALGLSLEHGQLTELFTEGEMIRITLQEEGEETPLTLDGRIRHFAKIRTKEGNSTICGVQFDLESRAVATRIEQLFAKAQRIFLRSLSERTQGQDINLTLQ